MLEDAGAFAEHCMTCGQTLEYRDRACELTCSVCGATEQGHIACPAGHYVCETCHDREALDHIRSLVAGTGSSSPFEIAEQAMALPGLPMLGCQHAFIAGGALAAALRNAGGHGFTGSHIEEVFERTRRQAHGGYCGLTGVCGITPAIGACVAVLAGSRCGTDEEQRLVMVATTRVSESIAGLTGPSCCKAYVRVSLDMAVGFLAENLGIELGRPAEIVCADSSRHPHGCREDGCPYFEPDRDRSRKEAQVDDGAVQGRQVAEATGIEGLVDDAVRLGAEKAKLIDTSTVAVQDWVALKCRYGCMFYDKDGYHPPFAPDPSTMRGVLGEYSKAILLNGPKGKALTEAVVKLEGEAYGKGFYKAFALTSLSSGGGST